MAGRRGRTWHAGCSPCSHSMERFFDRRIRIAGRRVRRTERRLGLDDSPEVRFTASSRLPVTSLPRTASRYMRARDWAPRRRRAGRPGSSAGWPSRGWRRSRGRRRPGWPVRRTTSASSSVEVILVSASPNRLGHDLADLDLLVVVGGVEQDRARAQDDRRKQLLLAAEDDDLGAAGPRDVDQGRAFRVDDVEGERIVLRCDGGVRRTRWPAPSSRAAPRRHRRASARRARGPDPGTGRAGRASARR